MLAIIFLTAGGMKLTESKATLSNQLTWTNDFSLLAIRMIGWSELLCGIGVIVPFHTGILPFLTPIAATGICLTMILAIAIVHLKKKENKHIAFNIFLFILAALVAYGRF